MYIYNVYMSITYRFSYRVVEMRYKSLSASESSMKALMLLDFPPRPEKSARPAATDATRVYEELRQDLLLGSFPPGVKLPIDQLRQRYGVGPIPMREALNRLISAGFVLQADQRGFYTPALSRTQLEELTNTRCWIHPILVRETLAHGDDRWEEALVLAAHRLARLQRRDAKTGSLNPAWEKQHRAFHLALIAGCPSRWLTEFYAHLFDHADLYRHQYLSAEQGGRKRDVVAEHRALVDAAVARDGDRLVTLLDTHIRRTTEVVLRGTLKGD